MTIEAGATWVSPDVYVDMLGQEIRVGDYVVYATTSGRSPVQKFARVEKILTEQKDKWVWPEGYGPGKPRVNKPYTYFKVGVREIKNGRNFHRHDSHDWVRDALGVYTRISKEVRVTYPLSENIVKVQEPK